MDRHLVLVCSRDVAGHEIQVADHVLKSGLTWRIALGNGPLVDALRRRGKRSVLTHRKQIYYAGGADQAAREWVREDLRAPSAGDFTLGRIAAAADVGARLDARAPRSVEQMGAALALREAAYGAAPYAPKGDIGDLRPGTYYLEGVDELHRRSYARVP